MKLFWCKWSSTVVFLAESQNEKTTWRGRPVFKGLTKIGTISDSNLLTYFSIFIFYDNLSALN